MTRPNAMTKPTSLMVATDGRGEFCTVQGAIDFVPQNNTKPVAITVRRGTYNEINYVRSNKPFITVRGEDRRRSVIQYVNNNNRNSGNFRVMFGVDAPDFTLENITLHNLTPYLGSQAEAFRSGNLRVLLNRVNLKSFQDTLLIQVQAFVTNSYIEGDVDFIWGGGEVFFQNCELKALHAGYYVQARNPIGFLGVENGYVFVHCRLTRAADLGDATSYLARIDPNVFPRSQVVFIGCAMDAHIRPEGWLLDNATEAPEVQFWEYQSTDLEGNPLDVSRRAPFSRQLSDKEAAYWSDPANVLRRAPEARGWVPYTVNAGPDAVTAGATITVDWSAADKHAPTDWVGLYRVGAPDTRVISWQYTDSATTGHLSFTAPRRQGRYEFRYFLNDGFTRAAKSNRVRVRRSHTE